MLHGGQINATARGKFYSNLCYSGELGARPSKIDIILDEFKNGFKGLS